MSVEFDNGQMVQEILAGLPGPGAQKPDGPHLEYLNGNSIPIVVLGKRPRSANGCCKWDEYFLPRDSFLGEPHEGITGPEKRLEVRTLRPTHTFFVAPLV